MKYHKKLVIIKISNVEPIVITTKIVATHLKTTKHSMLLRSMEIPSDLVMITTH